ncbi:hypothetical protein [Flavobacterium sp.]|uniref:hypothetical protein n=1 Tax=Flavobacterium sp. TaxID=239 RepID=UPI00121935F2|nr:hypothetical protein [Flavobacterium sp.]RZJ71605.1 MAG: hypothetical protein EOO49_09615 [Flavobacterium sp.]
MNGYFKLVPFVYLAAALFFLYSAYANYNEQMESWWIWLALSGLCVFMFFFRRRFAKKFMDQNQQPKK